MNNEPSATEKLNLLLEEKRHKIQDSFSTMKNVQNKINQYSNISIARYLLKDRELTSETVLLLLKNKDFISRKPKDFDDFWNDGREVSEILFELSMAKFLNDNGFPVVKSENHTGETELSSDQFPDILFAHNETKFFMECTMRTFSNVARYAALLPFYKQYLEIAQIYYNKYILDPRPGCCLDYIDLLHHLLTDSEKAKIHSNLETIEPDGDKSKEAISSKMISWMHLNQYISFSYQYLMEDAMSKALRDIGVLRNHEVPMKTMGTSECCSLDAQIINAIAIKIIEKLGKDYFQDGHFKEERIGIISISLSSVQDTLISPSSICIERLHMEMSRLLAMNPNAARIKLAFEKLYCIIIDTCWYNFFPNYAKEHLVVNKDKLPYYIVIYNPAFIVTYGRIFDQCITDQHVMQLNRILPCVINSCHVHF